ncbi:phage tail tip fiber protein [Sphingobium sp. YBL2]|uniref:phage tail tip fiber protein n=1 Tax=Sphingobium sp. (strain YBL2) TaxID=484429 RepID=UPI00155D889F|nr:DUF1983 domain-containing protein [Sphingobium sp. YBL2]
MAASIGAQITAKKPPARGTVNEVIISAEPPAPYLMGRTYSGGVLRHDVGYGATLKKVPNPYRGQVIEYSVAGPCDGLENTYVDYTIVPFSGGAATGYYNGYLYRDVRVGLATETALTPHFAGMPNWTANHKLSSKAAILLNGKFDKDGKRFASGWPATGAVWRGVKTYDARKDSTYPGGSGSHRINDEGTWEYSEDPGQHALAYALGRFRNGKKVFGVGLPVEGIIIEHFVELSNVCQANDWKVGGVIYEPGDRWANLKRILEAGGAEPLFIGGKLGLRINAPRVSIYDLTAGDLTEDDAEIPAAKTWRERRNGIRPKYRSEANKWTYVSSDLVSVPSYIADDGEEKFEELQWDLVQNKDQVAKLAAYRLVNGREIGPITLVCKPHMRAFGPGDMITLNLGADHALSGMDAVILKRSVDPGSMKVTLTLETETPGKHDFALGRTGTAPPAPALAATEDKDVIAAEVIKTDEIPWTGVLDDDPEHPKPEDGATVGMTDAEAVAFAQLESDTAAAQVAIAAAQTTITNMQADAAAVQAALTQAQNDILAAQDDILAQGGDIATIETTLGNQGASITSLQTTVSNHAGQLSTLTSTVSTQGATIIANSTAITTLTGNLAEYQLRLSTNRPNLLPNGSAEAGLRGFSGPADWTYVATNPNGSYFLLGGPSTGTFVLASSNIPLGAGTYTLSYETSNTGNPSAYCDVLCFDAGGALILDGGQNAIIGSSSWGDRAARAFTFTAPAGTSYIWVRLVGEKSAASDRVRIRRIKLETGSAWSDYSNEASVAQSFVALTTAEGSLASLTTTVSTQGATITSQQTAITNLTTRTATLETTVSTQGSSITTMQTAITTLQGNLATLTTTVRAGKNLWNNGGPDNGTAGYIDASNWTLTSGYGWGSFFLANVNGTYALATSDIPVTAGVTYSWSADLSYFSAAGSAMSIDILWYNSSGTLILDGANVAKTPNQDFGVSRTSVTEVAPAGAVNAKGRVIATRVTGSQHGARMLKFEQGDPSIYTSDAAISQSFQALSTLTTQYASLSSTVSTQGVTITSQQTAITTINGNITTLFGRWGVEIDVNGYVSGVTLNNNGSRSDFIVRADRFAVTSSSGSGTAYPFEVVGGVTRIKTAAIGDATIDTLKVANGAITNITYSTGTNTMTTGYAVVASVTMTPVAGTSVLKVDIAGVFQTGLGATGGTQYGYIRVRRGANVIVPEFKAATGQGVAANFSYFAILSGITGEQTFTVEGRNQLVTPAPPTGEPSTVLATIAVTEFKK